MLMLTIARLGVVDARFGPAVLGKPAQAVIGAVHQLHTAAYVVAQRDARGGQLVVRGVAACGRTIA